MDAGIPGLLPIQVIQTRANFGGDHLPSPLRETREGKGKPQGCWQMKQNKYNSHQSLFTIYHFQVFCAIEPSSAWQQGIVVRSWCPNSRSKVNYLIPLSLQQLTQDVRETEQVYFGTALFSKHPFVLYQLKIGWHL